MIFYYILFFQMLLNCCIHRVEHQILTKITNGLGMVLKILKFKVFWESLQLTDSKTHRLFNLLGIWPKKQLGQIICKNEVWSQHQPSVQEFEIIWKSDVNISLKSLIFALGQIFINSIIYVMKNSLVTVFLFY